MKKKTKMIELLLAWIGYAKLKQLFTNTVMQQKKNDITTD